MVEPLFTVDLERNARADYVLAIVLFAHWEGASDLFINSQYYNPACANLAGYPTARFGSSHPAPPNYPPSVAVTHTAVSWNAAPPFGATGVESISRLMPMPSGKAAAGQMPSTMTVSGWVWAAYLAVHGEAAAAVADAYFLPVADAEFFRGGRVDLQLRVFLVGDRGWRLGEGAVEVAA